MMAPSRGIGGAWQTRSATELEILAVEPIKPLN
jgi:hypothetical protein